MDFLNRRSVRLPAFDYGSTGAYFVTVCTHLLACCLGIIQADLMCLNELGSMVWEQWHKTFEKRPHFSPGAFVVMPNHFHGIVHINRPIGEDWNPDRIERFGGSVPHTLSTAIKGLKAAATSFAVNDCGWEGKLWQRGFHEHVIRDESSYLKIESYICQNSKNWQKDCFY